MKIAIIKNFYSPYVIGGAELNVEKIAKDLAKKGHNIIVITISKNIKLQVEQRNKNYKIYRIFNGNIYFPYPPKKKRVFFLKIFWWMLNLWNPHVYFSILKILKKEKPDIAQLHNFYGLSAAVFTAVAHLKIPMVFFPHDFYLACKNSSFMKNNGDICKNICILCRFLTHFHSLFIPRKLNTIFLSEFSKNILKKYFEMDGPVIHNACLLPKEKIILNMEYRKQNKNPDKLILLYMGRLDKHKGILTLLDVFKKINNRNIELLIAGVGEYEKVVYEMMKKDKRIKYFGFAEGREKENLFLKSDILVFPSEWYEVSPMVIQEAYGYGLPVLATNFGSITEHIEENKTGWLFNYQNSDDLADKILVIYSNRNKISIIRQNCFESALNNTYENFSDKVMKYCEKVLDQFNEK